MIVHPELKILVITAARDEGAGTWRFITDGMDHVLVQVEAETPTDLNGYQAVLTVDATGSGIDSAKLLSFVESGGTWLALAAYNIGFGHLEDARIITETLGGNPDDWSEVRANLPLLTQKKWYSRVKRGYARGWAPVHYVDNIRSYYEALMWLMSGELTDPIITRDDSETQGEDNAG